MAPLTVKEYRQRGPFERDTDPGDSYISLWYYDRSRVGSGPLYWRMGTAVPPAIELAFGYDGGLYGATVLIADKMSVAPEPPAEFVLDLDNAQGMPTVDPANWSGDSCVRDQKDELAVFWNGADLWLVIEGEIPARIFALAEGGEVLLNARNEFVGMVAKGLNEAERRLVMKSAALATHRG